MPYRQSSFKTAILFTAIGALVSGSAFAQDHFYDLFRNKEKAAEKLYAESNYAAALKILENILSRHPERIDISINLANCYYKLRQSGKAADLFENAVLKRHLLDDVSLQNYFMALNDLGRHAEAGQLMNHYAVPILNEAMGINFHILSTKINSEYVEYPVTIYKDGMVWVSNRPAEKPVQKILLNTQGGADRLLFSVIGEDAGLLPPTPFTPIEINDEMLHQGGFSLFEEDNKMIIALSVRKHKQAKAIPRLFLAAKHWEKWHIVKELFDDIDGSFSQPFVDESSKRIYFVSDIAGGFGGADIYYCTIDSDGIKGMENAGPSINTPANEMFPVINNGYLYFSSNGHPGIGGLDLFRARIRDEEIGCAENLGMTINSVRDDFAMIFDHYGSRGYFASGRLSETGSSDIFHFYMWTSPDIKDTAFKNVQ